MNGALRDASGTGSVDVYSQLQRVQRAAPAAIGLAAATSSAGASASAAAAAASTTSSSVFHDH